MTCKKTTGPGVVMFACSRGVQSGPAPARCFWCGKRAAKLCDFPVKRDGEPTTCDKPMCRGCATAVDGEADYCPPHARHARKQGLIP